MGIGGAERLVLTLAEGLLERGHAVAVSGPGGPLEPELERLAVHRVTLSERGRSPVAAAGAATRLASAMRSWRPDVVHGHNVRMSAVAGAAARLAAVRRRPGVVSTFHGVRHEEYRAAARLLRAADAVACVSADVATRLADNGYPPARLDVVRNAVTVPAAPPPDEREALAAELGPGPLVAAVGRLVPQKNHERLLDAVARLGPRHQAARFVIVGDGPLRQRLEAHARDVGVADRVRFAGARLDAQAIIAHADLLAFSSDWEGLSIAALEALAAGTPVVSTPVEGMAELLSTGAGLTAADMAPATLADAIAALLDDPARRLAMGVAARALIAERFSVGAMVSAYEALYRAQ
jgi:glycosyltransferase involved in cell wall biosynthesis